MNATRAETLYRETRVETASKARLVQLLLARAVEHARQAHAHCLAGRIEARFRENSDTASIVAILRGHLDMAQGGEIARSLDALYEHVSRTILRADLNNDASAIEHVIAILLDLEQAWGALAAEPAARNAAPSASVSPPPDGERPRLSLRL
jgi:flagellar protein FliS